jgi:hypothetical protein
MVNVPTAVWINEAGRIEKATPASTPCRQTRSVGACTA